MSDDAAAVGAVFEAVERHIAAAPFLPTYRRRPAQICEAIDLSRLGMNPLGRQAELDCVLARDVLNDRDVLVPSAIVQLRQTEPAIFPLATTNGVASGNSLLEATYHAFCELIERHAWSLYGVRCELLPRMLGGRDAGDMNFAAQLQFPTGCHDLDGLAQRILAAGLRLRVSYLRERHLPPVMLASIVEDQTDPPMSHIGLGCSLSAAHAALRAVTEAAQSRLTDIQGAREDARRHDDPRSTMPEHSRRLAQPPKDAWFFDLEAPRIDLNSIPEESTDDLAEDVRRLLSTLEKFGASSAIVVDMSPADMPVNVVRAIVPELETTCMDGRIGPSARKALNPFSTF